LILRPQNQNAHATKEKKLKTLKYTYWPVINQNRLLNDKNIKNFRSAGTTAIYREVYSDV